MLPGRICIMTFFGQVVKSKNSIVLLRSTTRVELPGLRKGMYFLKTIVNGQVKT
jgi:hypothetical protein